MVAEGGVNGLEWSRLDQLDLSFSLPERTWNTASKASRAFSVLQFSGRSLTL